MKLKSSLAALMVATGFLSVAAQAADLAIRLDVREIARKRVHTSLTLAVKPGPLDSMIGLVIKANAATLAWARSPLDMYALRLTVPRGATRIRFRRQPASWRRPVGPSARRST
jgi:hypothetical protein